MRKKSIFIGQAVSGEDINVLRKETKQVYEVLSQLGYRPYSSVVEGDKFEAKSNKAKMMHAFSKLNGFDYFLAIVRNERRSEGMLMEVGYCVAKNKGLIVAVNKRVRGKTYLDELADTVIEFDKFDDLIAKLRRLKLK